MVLREQSVAIAVIGVTGSGKSTFINLASGSKLPVRKSLGGCTTELESSTLSLDGRTVTLIDTPGFDDSTPSVLNVLKLISEYYSRLYTQGVKLVGVIYMHCVTEDHMGDLSRRNFLTFCKFCGETSLRDVVIVTNTPNSDGDARERESAHKDEFFTTAIENGARMLLHDGSQASAHAILRHLIHRTLTVQGDSADHGAGPGRTTNADAVRDLTDQVEHHTKAFGDLCQGIDAAKDEGTKKALDEEAQPSPEKIEHMVTQFSMENSTFYEDWRYDDVLSAQSAEVEVRTLAQAQLVEERAPWEYEKMEESSKVDARQKYGRLLAGGAFIFALAFYASRLVFDGSATIFS